jgi:hypothetical protein
MKFLLVSMKSLINAKFLPVSLFTICIHQLASVFEESSKNLILIFSLNKTRLKVLKPYENHLCTVKKY